ncbi:MAG: dependent protein [Actinomycetota bacterium]|nr:dependent protein [Actinomycetota bacterium]
MTAGAPSTVDPGPIDPSDVAVRLSEVRRRIASAGGGDRPIRIVAVTKGFGPDAVRAAVAAGVHDVGENYADELVAKHAAADPAAGAAPQSSHRWHFIGRVQRNKVKRLAPLVHLWQTVDRAAAGREIARRAPGARVLVQLNVTGQAGRNGCVPADAPALVDELRAMELDVVGLMAVGPAGPPEHARAAYRGLAAMADRLELPERSMGMTDDLEVAVEEGTTMVRVGRALFGARSVPTDLRR